MNELKFPNASQAFRLRNPEIFGAPVGTIQGAKRKQTPEDALGTAPYSETRGKNRIRSRDARQGARFRVTFVAYQRVLQDSDRAIGGLTDLRDVIADWLLPKVSQRMRDSDKLIQWEYGQVQTRGEEGVAVRIEKL